MEAMTMKQAVKAFALMFVMIPAAGIFAEFMRISARLRGKTAKEIAYGAASRCLAVMGGIGGLALVGLALYAYSR